ncbi:LysE family transporter [Paenibacillus alvei]|uniref:LysE family translocator n=1 Tax=Paenibacillus alvei TaxID=44250 RepID=UPI0013DA1571|nr:LysE family transporter [Paenibacillus alvei]NEZ41307.1 LysE family transporter [Paenibacillus alvei]
MLKKGFFFGMTLQFAVGPVCIFIFQTASFRGFLTAETTVLATVFIDLIFMLAAIFGIAAVIKCKRIKMGLNLFGAIVLCLFGMSFVANALDANDYYSLGDRVHSRTTSVFLPAILLVASNPLTIVFWAGVFSTRVLEDELKKMEVYVFSLGALCSTLFFLTLVACIGAWIGSFVTPAIMRGMNIIAGILLIGLGAESLLKVWNVRKSI